MCLVLHEGNTRLIEIAAVADSGAGAPPRAPRARSPSIAASPSRPLPLLRAQACIRARSRDERCDIQAALNCTFKSWERSSLKVTRSTCLLEPSSASWKGPLGLMALPGFHSLLNWEDCQGNKTH